MGNILSISKDVKEISKEINKVQDVMDISKDSPTSLSDLSDGRVNPTDAIIDPFVVIERQIYDKENLDFTFDQCQLHLLEAWRLEKKHRPFLGYLRYLEERVE